MTDDDKVVQPIGARRYGNTLGTATGSVDLSSFWSFVSEKNPWKWEINIRMAQGTGPQPTP